jgi:plastocyanin
VNFKEPGRYLVVCGVRPHFIEGMHGYVDVKA